MTHDPPARSIISPMKTQFSLLSLLALPFAVAVTIVYTRWILTLTERQVGSFVFGSIGIVCFVISIHSELILRKRLRHWYKTDGTIIASSSRHEATYPVIEYSVDGNQRTFVSKLDQVNVAIGQRVTVLYDPVTGEAEEYSLQRRLYSSGLSGLFGSLFMLVAIALFWS